MAEREENGQYAHGNTSGLRFGAGQTREGCGRPKSLTSSVKEHWNLLGAVDTDGRAKYSVADIEKIVKAPRSDKTIPMPRRIAAREILDGLKSGQVGRKIVELMFDRTEGKARQQIDVNANLMEVKRIVLVGSGVAAAPFLPDHSSPPVEPAKLPLLPDTALAPDIVEEAPEPINTRPAPIDLPSPPGRVHGPGESEG